MHAYNLAMALVFQTLDFMHIREPKPVWTGQSYIKAFNSSIASLAYVNQAWLGKLQEPCLSPIVVVAPWTLPNRYA